MVKQNLYWILLLFSSCSLRHQDDPTEIYGVVTIFNTEPIEIGIIADRDYFLLRANQSISFKTRHGCEVWYSNEKTPLGWGFGEYLFPGIYYSVSTDPGSIEFISAENVPIKSYVGSKGPK